MYHDHPENVFYGTDDGDQDGSFGEFAEFKAHYESVAPARRDNIHMISVVGGLYGLNLIPLWRPRRLTIFDINPAAITYFRIIHACLRQAGTSSIFSTGSRPGTTTPRPRTNNSCERTSV